jgi:hypothetical protein
VAVPWVGQLGWLVTGRGLGTGVWLGLVLVAVLLVDAHRRHVAFLGRGDAAVDGVWSPRAAAARLEPRIDAAFASTARPGTAGVLRAASIGVRSVLVTATRAAAQIWHDVVVVVAGHSCGRAARGTDASRPTAPDTAPAAGGFRARREALRRGKVSVAVVRSWRAEAMALTTPGSEPEARRRLRVVAGSAAAALALSSLLVAWLGAVAIGPDITGPSLLGAGRTGGDGVWLAGLFDDLDGWWSGLSLGEQLLVGAGIAALVALSGGSLGLAFGLSGVATYGLSKAGGLADLTRDPRGATRDYLTTATWQDLAVDLAEFGLTFAPGSFAGAATGRAVRAGVTEYAADPAAFRARRAALLADDTGAVDFSGWGPAREHMSDRARAYQEFVTGRSAEDAFAVNGVKFDNRLPDGTLVDAKGPRYAYFLANQHKFIGQSVARQLIATAQRQLKASPGTPIHWYVAEADAADAMRRLLASRQIFGITITHVPMGAAP